MKLKRTLTLFGILAIASTVLACRWDNDTLSEEAKGLPNVLDAIVGRVRIYPPEYYELRIKLANEQLKKNPNDLAALDNLMMAHDHLGQWDEALQVAERKRVALKTAPQSKKGDHMYRYYSNLGTIQGHLAFQKEIPEEPRLRQAIQSLEKGLVINPDAHFGREKYQVLLYKVLLDDQVRTFSPEREWKELVKQEGYAKAQTAILGMIAMGDGPQSPILLDALLHTLNPHDGHLGALLIMRMKELNIREEGYWGRAHPYGVTDKETVNRQFAALRKDATEYQHQINSFVKDKVAKGLHPDNDPTFWEDWKEPDRVNLRGFEPLFSIAPAYLPYVLSVAALVVLGVVLLLLKDRLRRKRLKKS